MPGELRVLAPGIVVPVLRAADLVAAQKHGHAVREEHGREEIPLLALAQREHPGIVGPFPPTPQFHERLSSDPSRFPSRFASLCFCS